MKETMAATSSWAQNKKTLPSSWPVLDLVRVDEDCRVVRGGVWS